MNEKICLKPIGIIRTPYKEPKGISIQGKFEKDAEGRVELHPEYAKGLKDLEGFSHVILVYYFNRSEREDLVGRPFIEDEEHGIFAIRSPLNIEDVKTGRYPITRPLNQYINGSPKGEVLDFIKFELSPEGQRIVEEEGFFPVSVSKEYVDLNKEAVGL